MALGPSPTPVRDRPARVPRQSRVRARVGQPSSSSTYWARAGPGRVDAPGPAARLRVEAGRLPGTPALEGARPQRAARRQRPRSTSAIQQHAQAASYGELLAAEGVTVVALDDDGRLVRYADTPSSEMASERSIHCLSWFASFCSVSFQAKQSIHGRGACKTPCGDYGVTKLRSPRKRLARNGTMGFP